MQLFHLCLPFLNHPSADLRHRYLQQMHHALLRSFFLYIFGDGPEGIAILASEVKPKDALFDFAS